jgi:hypothetical protein
MTVKKGSVAVTIYSRTAPSGYRSFTLAYYEEGICLFLCVV